MARTSLLAPLLASLLLVGACTDRVTGPTIAPPASPAGMIATTCTAIDACAPDDPYLGVAVVAPAGNGNVSMTILAPAEAYGDAAFYEAESQADGPCDATRNAETLAWVEFVGTAYAGGATVIGTASLTAATAGAAAPVTVFVTAYSSYQIAKSLNAYYGAAKENQLCRLRNRLYPYNHP